MSKIKLKEAPHGASFFVTLLFLSLIFIILFVSIGFLHLLFSLVSLILCNFAVAGIMNYN